MAYGGGGMGAGFALIVVLFILLIIVGTAYVYQDYYHLVDIDHGVPTLNGVLPKRAPYYFSILPFVFSAYSVTVG